MVWRKLKRVVSFRKARIRVIRVLPCTSAVQRTSCRFILAKVQGVTITSYPSDVSAFSDMHP